MQRSIYIGLLVIALIVTAVGSLAQVACYELRMCSGDLHTYTTYILLTIFCIFALSILHLVVTKLRK